MTHSTQTKEFQAVYLLMYTSKLSIQKREYRDGKKGGIQDRDEWMHVAMVLNSNNMCVGGWVGG